MLSVFFKSFFLSSFDEFAFADDEEATVYGLNWNPEVLEGVMLAVCMLVLLISVALLMIGATFELFNFFIGALEDGLGDSLLNSGTISDEFIDLVGTVYDLLWLGERNLINYKEELEVYRRKLT